MSSAPQPDRTDDTIVFVYGTLLPGVPNSRFSLLEPAEPLGSASIPGLLYQLEGYPGAVPSPDATERIQGELFRLVEAEAALRRMDRYEGYVPADPQGCEFRRDRVACLRTDDASAVEAWVYYYALPVDGLSRIPRGDYVAFVRGGGSGSSQQQQQQQQ